MRQTERQLSLRAVQCRGPGDGTRQRQKAELWTNGGFFVFRQAIFDYLHEGEELVEAPFHRLIEAGKLFTYKHDGFWACMDTFKEKQQLDDLVLSGSPPWQVWDQPGFGRRGPAIRRACGEVQDRLPCLMRRFPSVRQVLCLGAHADDIEIGCGGTVLRLVSLYPNADFHWVVFSAPGTRKEEAESSAGRFLRDAGSKTIEVRSFRDGFFPYVGAEIKDFFEDLKKDASTPT